MDWALCVICQKKTSEQLTCPLNNHRYDSLSVFEDFLTNVEEFKKLHAIPIAIEHCENISAADIVEN